MSFMIEAAWTSSPAKRRKMPSKSLPTTELREEDDWTRVKDPKEKKRIQNRVAQRTYRHRMKARLGELQARLDSHEGRSSQNNTNTSVPVSIGTNGSTATTMHNATRTPESCNDAIPHSTIITSTWNGNPTPPARGVSEETSSPLIDTKPPQMPLLQTNMYDGPVPEPDSALFQDPTQFLNSPPHSQPSPKTHGLLSPPGQAVIEPTGKPPEFMLDCLRFQTQLLDRLNTIQQDGSFPAQYGQADSVTSTGSMSTTEQANCVAAPFTPTHTEGMEFAFEAPVEVWKSEPLAQKLARQDTSSADALNFPPMPGNIAPVMETGPESGPHPVAPPMASLPSQQTSLEERFERIMEQVEAAGFESFDALVATYYSAPFGEASPLANEQRLSRNRRLPKVVSDVFQATRQWSGWERTGFYEEILRSTETMLISENVGARNSLLSKLAPLVEAQKMMNAPITPDVVLAMKRIIQEELPNSWALTMALAADQRTTWQWDRSNTALATVLLLNFAGRIPNEELLGLLGACL